MRPAPFSSAPFSSAPALACAIAIAAMVMVLAGCAAEPTKEATTPIVATGAARPAADPGAVPPTGVGPVSPSPIDTRGDSPGATALTAGLIAALGAIALAFAAAGFWAGRRTRPVPEAVVPDGLLVRGLIGSYDLARDDAQRGHVEQVLRQAGVVALRPGPGVAATDDRCEIVGTASAPSAQQVGAVAELVRVGWADGAVLMRPAQVVVFADAPRPSDPQVGPDDDLERHR